MSGFRHCYVGFRQNFTHSFWLRFDWWQPSWTLPSSILTSCTQRTSLIHSDSSRWRQPSWILPSLILPSWIQPCCTKLWLNLIQSDSNLIMETHLDDGFHIEFCHLGFSHFAQNCDFKLSSIWLKLDSWLTQLDDGSHLEFKHCHHGFKHLVICTQIHSKTFYLHADSDSNSFNLINLMMATILNSSILNSATLDSAILYKTLPQTSSLWLKHIHSDSTWWWQPSWILPCWIQTLQILDSDTLLSSLRFTKKHSSSTLTLTQTNSI